MSRKNLTKSESACIISRLCLKGGDAAVVEKEILEKISDLSPTGFENLAFDIVRALGFQNLVWRTPGPDGGRDIDGLLGTHDPTGFLHIQKWHIECKQYHKTINWKTVWEKLSHADALSADVLFLMTNSNPSPQCENRISEWNIERRRPAIRVWRGYNFINILRANLDISIAHGIVDSSSENFPQWASIALELAKLIHSAQGAIEFESKSNTAIEAASALAELLEHRLSDLARYGRFHKGPVLSISGNPSWLVLEGSIGGTEEVSFRALTSLMRHFKQCETVTAKRVDEYWQFSFDTLNRGGTKDLQKNLRSISHWMRCDDMISEEEEGTIRILMRGQ